MTLKTDYQPGDLLHFSELNAMTGTINAGVAGNASFAASLAGSQSIMATAQQAIAAGITALAAATTAVTSLQTREQAIDSRLTVLETVAPPAQGAPAAPTNLSAGTITSSSVALFVTPPPGQGTSTSGDSTGVPAFRIADMMERLGWNIYPSVDGTSNIFGSLPANYSMASIVAAYTWLCGSSGLITLSRGWCYQNYSLLSPFLPQLAATTGTKFTMEVGGTVASDTTGAIITMAGESHNATGNSAGKGGWMIASEGWNEPNGIGGETSTQTADGDVARAAGLAPYPEIIVMSASIVIGLAFPDGYISGYMGGNLSRTVASVTAWNVHYYPSQNPDFSDGAQGTDPLRVSEFRDVLIGTNTGYGAVRPQYITEWHPTLYMNGNPNKNNGGWDDAHDTYFSAIYVLTAFRLGYEMYIWYALYDFGVQYKTGLWANDARTDTPRGSAYLFRAMYQLTGDTGATKRSFTPGHLNYTIQGLPPSVAGNPDSGGHHMLFENSLGQLFLFIWNSQQAPGGAAVTVTVNFTSKAMARVTHYNLTSTPATNMTPVTAAVTNVPSFSFALNASVHMLAIDYGAVSLVDGYTFRVARAGTAAWTVGETGPAPSGTIAGLLAATAYDFQCFAFNAAGPGPPTPTLTRSTLAATTFTVSPAWTEIPKDTSVITMADGALITLVNGVVMRDTGSGPLALGISANVVIILVNDKGVLYQFADWGTGNGWWYADLTQSPPWVLTSDPRVTAPGPGAAMRVFDAMRGFGFNAFPNGQDGAGSAAGSAAHITALTSIYSGSGFGPTIRLYSDSLSAAATLAWAAPIAAAVPHTTFVLCFASSSTGAAAAVLVMNALRGAGLTVVMEGQNEANNGPNLGQPVSTPTQTRVAQQTIYNAAHPLGVRVLSPTIALGINVGGATPAADWFGSELAAVNAACDEGAQHNYPNSGGGAHEEQTRAIGFAHELGKQTSWCTEYHPLLFNGNRTDTTWAGWQTGLFKLSSTFDLNCPNVIWFCFHDYAGAGFRVPVGLVSGFNPASLTPAAKVMKALFAACADTGATAQTFTTDVLDIVSVTGLPAGVNAQGGGHLRVMQCSDRSFRVAVGCEQDDFGAASTVTINFGSGKTITRTTLNPATGGTAVAQTWPAGTTSISFSLAAIEIQVLTVVNAAAASANLSVDITLGASTFTFAQGNGVSLGNYVDPQGRFTQGSVKVTNPGLPGFSVLFRPDVQAGATRNEVVFEYGTMFDAAATAPVNLGAYSVVISKAGSTLATVSVPQHYWFSRWRWQSAVRPVAGTTVPGLIAAGRLPDYQAGVYPHQLASPVWSAYTIMGTSSLEVAMNAGGDRDEIGLITEQQADYLCTGSATALTGLRTQLEVSGTCQWHYRDETTNAPVDWVVHASLTSAFPPTIKATSTPITLDQAHIPPLAYVHFLLTGDPYALEEMQFALTWNYLSAAPGSRGGFQIGFAVRAHAWFLRDLARCATVTPATIPGWLKPAPYFQTLLNADLAYTTTNFVNSTTLPFSAFQIMSNGNGSPATNEVPANLDIQTFMEEYELLTLGHVVQLGHTDWRPVLNWKAQSSVARTNGTSGWFRSWPCPYSLLVRSSVTAPFVTTWAAAWTLNTTFIAVDTGLARVPPSDARITDPDNIPAGFDLTYPIFMLADLAVCKTIGVTATAACHTWLLGQINNRSIVGSYARYKWSILA